MKPEIKKLLILNLPYLLFVYLFDKVGAAIRLSPGADASGKLLHLGEGFAAAFSFREESSLRIEGFFSCVSFFAENSLKAAVSTSASRPLKNTR